MARIEYPGEVDPSYLIYLKPTLTGDEEADLQAYAAQNRDFPHHPTPDQLYDEDRFESYRQLGEHIGDRLCEEIQYSVTSSDLWTCQSVLSVVLNEELDHYLLHNQKAALEQLAAEKARRRRHVQRIESTRARAKR
jgi:hypothetical protein